jgi:hypothetical protein
LLLLPLTALAQTVTTDNDPKAPFATYKAYAWAQGTAAQNPLNETRIHDGVDARMVAAGFKLVNDNADVNVASHAVAQEKKELNAMGMGGGLRFGGGMATAKVDTYVVGSLVVDLYDGKTKQLVWRGAATDTMSDKPEKNAEMIGKALDKMFKAYPPKAKQAGRLHERRGHREDRLRCADSMRSILAAVVLVLVAAAPARAQTTGQLWGDIVLEKPKSHRLVFNLDLEPKVLVAAPANDPGWWAVDVLPGADYVVNKWFDVSGEMTLAYTKQTNDRQGRAALPPDVQGPARHEPGVAGTREAAETASGPA